ncbi:MAG: UDP-N-acetylglucosamine 1-carboxyvinyltransferase [Oscillospiraceae bacterium]|nr:UDP-N-acetylglucosamine 1-carboxyvinyltransferase [Oscillospiraceae bacterium]
MKQYDIIGGEKLTGEVDISGTKNAAVAVIAAALLVDGVCYIDNIPEVGDVTTIMEILSDLGVVITRVAPNSYSFDCRAIKPDSVARAELYGKCRASYYVLGALLGRFGKVTVATPGGCDFGYGTSGRPIDQHIKGFEALGAEVEHSGGWIRATNNGSRLQGSRIYMDVVSVGATINTILAAVLSEGTTIIENAALEPHVVDLANFLNKMGAAVRGAGSSTIRVYGVDRLIGGDYSILPDQIEAGTYLCMAAATGGRITVRNVVPRHLYCITSKLSDMGVRIEENGDCVTSSLTRKRLKSTNVKTAPYPGFPTDMQPQITTLLCTAEGTSKVTEAVWDNRFQYLEQLQNMGAIVSQSGRDAVVEGSMNLTGAPIIATDLRAGAAMVIAGLAAEGVTRISDVWKIERGYEDLVEKLRRLGANITIHNDIEIVDMASDIIGADKRAESAA